jgi:serine/threonine protein kinase
MVMELCESGTLEDLLFNMEEHDTEKIIGYYSQIVKGIKFMYDKKILHRDLKPSNLLVKKDKIKIADFGTSKMNKSS